MFRFIGRLFSYIWKTLGWIRATILNLLLLAFIVIIIQSIRSAPEIKIPRNNALLIAPSGVLVDQPTYNPTIIDLLADPQDRPQETNIHDLIKAIRHARDDGNITGLVIKLDFMTSAGMSKIEEIGQAINYFKESGKVVIAFSDAMNQQQYLLASYADEVYINKMGGIYLTGFGVYRNYYKSAADKLAVKFHVFRVGEYKDAVEPFIRDDMSAQSKEHIGTWITELWQRYTGTIEEHRDLAPGTIDTLVTNLDSDLINVQGDAASYAVNAGLVDAAYSKLELRDMLAERFGLNNEDNVDVINTFTYLNNPLFNHENNHNNKIGLIVATGNILDGEQPESAIGSVTLSKLIRTAREDDDISALVLRVDSGGGSAFASEVIRDQLRLTRDSGKPVFISMGSVAASGGYWIATPATEIWSTPSTLTGSIGVFGLIPNLSDSLNKLGIYSDGVGTSDLADAYNIDRELSPRAKKIIQTGVDNIYQQFIELVATARGSNAEDVHKIAQGRVWSGDRAQQLGLVDKLGSLQDVLDSAAQSQGFSQYSVKRIARELSPKEQLVRTLMQQAAIPVSNIRSQNSTLSMLNTLVNNTNIQHDFSSVIRGAHSAPQLSTYARCVECVAP